MSTPTILPVTADEDIKSVAALANEIWHEHYVPIIGEAQVNYMVEKFQSFPAICNQIQNDAYEYFKILSDEILAGYIGVQVLEDSLFLSKLYIKKDCRGQGLSRHAIEFLKGICKERRLHRIYWIRTM